MNKPSCALAALSFASALAAAAPAAARDVPRAVVEGVDGDLRDRIEAAVGETENPPETRAQARRRAREAAERAETVLRSEGYYGAQIEPDITDSEPPRGMVRITPGPRFVIADPDLEWLEPPPEPGVGQEAEAAIELEPGAAGRAADVVAAEGRIVAALTRRGYADAKAGERRVVVDHATGTVRPTYRVDAGSLVRLDGVRLDTEGRTNPAWVAGLAPWSLGERYDPEDVAELERRLLETGVYDSVAVALTPPSQTDAEGLRPVLVSLADRPRRITEVGAGFSTSEGFGFDGVVTWYNRFGRADTLRGELRLAEIDSRLGLDWSIPHWRRPGRTLRVGAELFFENTDAYERAGAGAMATLQQRLGRTSFFTYGASFEGARNRERQFDEDLGREIQVERDFALLTGLSTLTLDRSNDPLDPSSGWRVNLDVQPTLVAGDDSLGFVRAQGQVSVYVPLDEAGRTVIAGRLRLGSILGGNLPGVPSDRRFYAGGGGSVRGYEYQGIGPELADGTPTGGLSLVETSLEARRAITGRWGAVAFVEGGAVGTEQYPTGEDVRWAAGAGVRYQLPFGPVRADVAFPLNKREGDPDFQIYVSIGQAF